MDTLPIQIMMGVSLAACTGLRASIPVLIVGILAKMGHIHLNPSYMWLSHTNTLIIFGIAAVLEFFGDKIIAVDHFLDMIGTFVRPAIGFMVSSSLLTHTDPATTMAIGLIMGGGSALTIHSGKAALRAKSSATAMFHGGIGNTVLSFGEDLTALFGTALAIVAPIVAFFFTLMGLTFAVLLVYLAYKAGKHIFQFIQKKRTPTSPAVPPSPQ